MKNIKKNCIIYIFLFICFIGLFSHSIIINSKLVNNIVTILRLFSYISLLFYFGYRFRNKDNKNDYLVSLLKIYFIILLLVTLLNINEFKDQFIFKTMSFISFLSPIVRSTSFLNYGAFILPIYIVISTLILFILDRNKILNNKKNKKIVFISSLFLSIIYGFICYKKGYFLVDDRFLNLFNPFNIFLISLTGYLCNNNDKLPFNKRLVLIFILAILAGLVAVYIIDDIIYIRFRVYISVYLVLIIQYLFFKTVKNIDIDEDRLFLGMIITTFVSFYIFRINIFLPIKLSLYLLLIILMILIACSKKTLDFNIKDSKDIIFKAVIIILLIVCLFYMGKNSIKAYKGVKRIINNDIEDVTDYLDPIVKNAENVLGDENVYSYLYVDDYKESGFLSNSRYRYRTVPNEMVNFNMVSRVFNYGTDDELLEFLCNTKVDYIIVRKSKRVEEIMNIKVPKKGLIYKKNNEICSNELEDYFISIEEVTE